MDSAGTQPGSVATPHRERPGGLTAGRPGLGSASLLSRGGVPPLNLGHQIGLRWRCRPYGIRLLGCRSGHGRRLPAGLFLSWRRMVRHEPSVGHKTESTKAIPSNPRPAKSSTACPRPSQFFQRRGRRLRLSASARVEHRSASISSVPAVA